MASAGARAIYNGGLRAEHPVRVQLADPRRGFRGQPPPPQDDEVGIIITIIMIIIITFVF